MKLTSKIIAYLSFSILLIVIPATLLIWNHQRETLFEQARVQAQTLFDMIVVTRQWVADNRGRIEPVPAVATKELSIYAAKMTDIRFHITSNNLVNPDNAPDEFEKLALSQFEQGKEEFSTITTYKDMGDVYRFMAPLKINAACLKCHDYQGYNIGDLRGGISVTIPLGAVQKAITYNNKLFYAFAFITFVGIVFVVSVLLNNLVLRHIRTLRDAADDVMHQNYGKKTGIQTNDELSELADVFDSMSERIEKSEDILKSRLKDSISKYVELVEELKGKNRELEKVSQFKTDVLDNVSHEIRTPMTKILSYSEMILDPELSQDQEIIGRAGEIIKNNLLILRNLFNQMITMNRLEHSQYSYFFSSTNVVGLLDGILDNFASDMKENGITLKKINFENEQYIFADPQALTYVFNNLISNGIKYNKLGGEIKVEILSKGDMIDIIVTDTGVGIPENDLKNVFGRFYRGENVRKTHSGTGLGLAIAYRIVLDHDGEIMVYSTPEEFTRFDVTLPIKKDIQSDEK